jgi:uncharacterized Fe-S radical SAM superfamily protein PflX
MIQFLNDIEKADQGAKLSNGNNFLESLQIMEMNRISRRLHEKDIDSIIKITQQLELQHVAAKRHGDFDPSINGEFMLD